MGSEKHCSESWAVGVAPLCEKERVKSEERESKKEKGIGRELSDSLMLYFSTADNNTRIQLSVEFLIEF